MSSKLFYQRYAFNHGNFNFKPDSQKKKVNIEHVFK